MKNKLTVGTIISFLVASGLFGLATTPMYLAYYPLALVLVIALGVGLLFGLLLNLLLFGGERVLKPAFGSQAQLLIEDGRATRRILRPPYFVLPLVGLGLGFVFAEGFLNLPLGYWQELEAAPQPVVTLIDNVEVNSRGDTLFVKLKDAQIYAYNCPLAQSKCIWLHIDQPPKPGSFSFFHCGLLHSVREPTPLLTGEVSQHVVFGDCGGGVSRVDHFVLMQDGSIWHWAHWESAYDILLFAPLVLVAGLIAGGAEMVGLIVYGLWVSATP